MTILFITLLVWVTLNIVRDGAKQIARAEYAKRHMAHHKEV